jgi:hypothetical protein
MTANGSRRWFGYTADNGDNFAVELDESIYESVNLAFPGVAAGAIPIVASSDRPISMRRVTCSRVVNDETLRASFYVGTRDGYDTLLASGVLTVDGTAWNIQRAFGETRQYIPPTDTAQLDGDVDSNLAV